MEENSELEEGEAFQYKDGFYNNNNNSNNNVDPDIALSYIDEKIQNVLGHFQKDFEGGVSAENLGAKFGGYGSFLPTYERTPQRNSIWSHPKTPQRNSSTPRSPNMPVEVGSQSTKVPLYATPSGRPGISSFSANALHKSGLACDNVSFKQESSLSSALVSRKSNIKDENSNKSGNLSDQRSLKVRIKVGSDSIARKNAAIYSGLGLDISPSSSLGNSPEESGGMLPPSDQTVDESPTSILQVMTSFPVPGGSLISPLHDNLLCLIKKDRLSRDVKSVLKGSRTNFGLLVDESVSFMGNEKLSKGKEVKFPMKSERAVEVKHEDDTTYENITAFSAKIRLENTNPDSKNMLSNNLKSMPPRDTANGDGTLRVTERSSEIPVDADRDGVRDRLFSSDLVEEDSLESRSGQDSGKNEKRNACTQSSSVEKVPEHRAVTSNNDGSVNLRGNKKSKKSKTRAPSNGFFDASRNEEDFQVASLAPSKQKISQQPAFGVQDDILMSSRKERRQSEDKQLHDTESCKKTAALPPNESLGVSVSGPPKDMTGSTHGVPKSKDKMQKLKLQESSKFRDSHRDQLDSKLEQKNSKICMLERPSGNRLKDSTIDDLEVVHNESFDDSRDRFCGKGVGNQLIPCSSVKDVASLGTSATGNALAPEVAPPTLNSVLIEEHWVCCDSCQKWRLLPYGTMPEQLPEKWLCSMLNWLPGMNRCDISEEETTKALNALYQVPLAVGQNDLRNHAKRIASGVHVQHVDHNHPSLNSVPGPAQGKKKRGLKEIAKAGSSSGLMQASNSSNNHLQESVKSRSVNNMNQLPVDANLVNKFSLSKSQHSVAEIKQNAVDGAGVTKQVKMKNKREADHYGYGTAKKTKRDVSDADKHRNSDMDLRRMGLISKSGLSNKASGKDLLKSNECSLSGDVKCDMKEKLLVSVKKLQCPSQISSDGRSLDVRNSDRRDISLKKRKLKEWQDDQNGFESTANAEESSESGLKKEKKSRVSKTWASIMDKHNDKLDKKEKEAHISLSRSQDHVMDVVDAERCILKDQQPRKHGRQFTYQQNLDGTDSLRKDIGHGHLSIAAASSSSKVSGSFKTRTTFEDVKGSPVESVSSSPLRTPFSEKLGSSGGNILGKDDATNGGLLVINEFRRCRDRKADDQINQSGTAKKERVSCDPHPEGLKFSPLDYQDGDAKLKITQTKYSSDMLNGGGEIMEHHESSVDLLAARNCHDVVRVEKNLKENMRFLQKSGNGPSLRLKDNDRSSTSDFDRDETKVFEPVNDQGDILNKRIGYESEIDLKSHASLHKRMKNAKHSIPDKSSSKLHSIPDKSISKLNKDEKVNVGRSGSVGKFSKDSRVENPLKQQDHDDANKKLGALHCTKRNAAVQGNLTQDSDKEIKVDKMQKELKSDTPNLDPHAEWEAKREGQIHQSAQGSQQEGGSDGRRLHASGNGDVLKTSRPPGNNGTQNGAQCIVDMRSAKDLTAPISGRTNSSSETATNALKEAKDLRDYADRLKVSGFGFESNEINFQAALKFLHGASLLETCNEAGRQGQMTQMQAYSMTAKLCECCAVEYERRHEMAAAALAFKCMEVAHWRVVYCKNSSLSRDDLQACLQTFSQGESPSSSASDIDNLNNQATVDKATISKGTFSHVAGNPVIVARNHANLLRLLDFTQDVNFAMEASRKSHNAYSAANVVLEEAQNRDCIISVKKVIDFGFQDVEELLRLVQQAMEAITRAGLVDARD